MKLPIIDGRECLPVRLLPYLTSWCPVTPDVVAKLFSQRDAWRTWTAWTFKLDGDSKHHKLLSREWDRFDDELTILASDLKLRETFDLQKYPEWRRRSVGILPAAVFVWRDEFEDDYARTFAKQSYPSIRPGAREISEEESEAELQELIRLGNDSNPSDEEGLSEIEQRVERDMVYRDGDGKLCFDPLLSDEEWRLVFQGFEALVEGTQRVEAAPSGEALLEAPIAVQTHRTRGGRNNLLTAIVEAARVRAGGSYDAAVVWVQLERIAGEEDRPPPLVGVNSAGIRYTAGGKVKTFTVEALRDRLRRASTRDKAR